MGEGAQGPLAIACTWKFVHPEFLVTPLLMAPVCVLSQGPI